MRSPRLASRGRSGHPRPSPCPGYSLPCKKLDRTSPRRAPESNPSPVGPWADVRLRPRRVVCSVVPLHTGTLGLTLMIAWHFNLHYWVRGSLHRTVDGHTPTNCSPPRC